MIYPYLKDNSFLANLDKERVKTYHVKIILKDWQENVIREIQGNTIDGNINIDGNSNMRRTGSLTMTIDPAYNEVELQGIINISRKCSIEIGIENTTAEYSDFPIIWFPVGCFVITQPNLSIAPEANTLSVQLQDYMCLLNGAVGGQITSAMTLDMLDTYQSGGDWYSEKVKLFDIILELVNHIGQIPLQKIIINDIPDMVKKVVQWSGADPLYIYKKTVSGQTSWYMTLSQDETATVPAEDVFKYVNGQDIGFDLIPFVYPQELAANAGQSVAEVLDIICQFLGNFEYFFDIDGNFVFREKKNYLNKRQSSVLIEQMKNDNYLVDYTNSLSVYTFEQGTLSSGYNKTPQTQNIKNSFVIWGQNEAKIPIKYHLVLDTKPVYGNTYRIIFFYDDLGVKRAIIPHEFTQSTDFPAIGNFNEWYLDLTTDKSYKWDTKVRSYVEQLGVVPVDYTTTDWRTELYFSCLETRLRGLQGKSYSDEVITNFPLIIDFDTQKIRQEYVDNPAAMPYFFDMCDVYENLSSFSVSAIGERPIVYVDNKINCLFTSQFPDLVILNVKDVDLAKKRADAEARGQNFIQVPAEIYKNITSGGRNNSAFDKMRELLFGNTFFYENISMNTIPILHLDVNSRVTIVDTNHDIGSNYMLNNLSYNLALQNGMSMSLTKIVDKM